MIFCDVTQGSRVAPTLGYIFSPLQGFASLRLGVLALNPFVWFAFFAVKILSVFARLT
jgi:hypothetical protein